MQFDKPIGSFQAVKHRLADMLVDVEGMRSAVYYAAWCIGASHPEYVGWLVRRVAQGDFDEIVLEKRIDRAPSWWYGSLQFGPRVIDAVASNYRLEARVGAYFVYVPRS